MARFLQLENVGTCLVLLVLFQPIKCESTGNDQPVESDENVPVIEEKGQYFEETEAGQVLEEFATFEESEEERMKRDLECDPSPQDALIQPCVACKGEIDYLHNGCRCDICRPPNFMERMCECTADGQVSIPTKCSLPKQGFEFMNASNWCSRPFRCSICPGDLEIKKACTAYTDTQCGCPVNTDRTDDPTRCEPIPTCPENHEIQRVVVPGSNILKYECIMCEPGYHQPDNNSWQPCRLETFDTTSPTPIKPDVTPKGKDNKVTTPPSDSEDTEDVTTKPTPTSSPEKSINCTSDCPCPPPVTCDNITNVGNTTSNNGTSNNGTSNDGTSNDGTSNDGTSNDGNTINIGNTDAIDGTTRICIPIRMVYLNVVLSIIPILAAMIYASMYPDHIKWVLKTVKLRRSWLDWMYGTGPSSIAESPRSPPSLTYNFSFKGDSPAGHSITLSQAGDSPRKDHPVVHDDAADSGLIAQGRVTRQSGKKKHVRDRSKSSQCSI